jgi:DNA modification methylase
VGSLKLKSKHRVLCGDSTSADDVDRLMGGEMAALILADPPYGMGKESEGVVNDNLHAEKLDAFQMKWWRAFRPHIADNASAYIWGNAPDLWRLWYLGGLSTSERMTIRSEVVWAKGNLETGKFDGMGQATESGRSYANLSERCLFFMLGEQGFNNNADNYWEGWDPIMKALAKDCESMGWGAKDIKMICGVGMYGHWFTRSQWTFIPREHYEKLQAAASGHDAFTRDHDDLTRDHDDLKRDHDDLKRDFYATRAFFDNTHDNMTDVWEFPRVVGVDRHGHATPKPVAMIARAIKSSSQPEALIIEPFLGSGTTLIAAEQLGRKCYGLEISPAYCDVIVNRWQKLTGERAVNEKTGDLFPVAEA